MVVCLCRRFMYREHRSRRLKCASGAVSAQPEPGPPNLRYSTVMITLTTFLLTVRSTFPVSSFYFKTQRQTGMLVSIPRTLIRLVYYTERDNI